jgi:ketosteroid isomerase-like protein
MLSKWDRLVASLQAYHAGDLDAALDYWDEAASIRLVGAPPGGHDAFDGRMQIRLWLEGLLAERFEIQEELVREDDDTVTVKALSWSDATRRLGVAPLVATEVYVFEGNRIRSLTWTLCPESLARLQAALPPA